MENCVVNESINNDFLSQSYSQSIERITGTKDSTFNFQIPKELLEIRKKTWDNLFTKYSKKTSDDIELNIDTLEPEEEEEEKAASEEDYSCGQRVPMRKPATLVQYWINTGNQPYKLLLDENEWSEAGLSLSEKEVVSLSASLVTNAINADSDRDEVLEMDFQEKQVSKNIAHKIIEKDTSLTAFHRKKLYTGRDSPVDLILTETHGTSRLSRVRQSLHPALDPDGMIKRKSVLTRKGKNKQSLSAKRSLGFKKVKRKERRELDYISNKAITDISNKYTNDEIQNSIIDDSFKSLSDLDDNSVDRQDDIPFKEYDDTNISAKNDKFSEQNLVSLNLKPVVLLERLKPPFNRCKLKFGENTHIALKKSKCNDRHLNKFKKLNSCEIENLELETIDSDQSTILICRCNANALQPASSLSDCPLDSRLNIEDDFSASNADGKDGRPSSSKGIDMSQNKELHVEGLSQSSKKDYTNAAMESQVLNKNDHIWQNVLSNKSKTYSHLHGRNEMDNVKLREIKVLLERLPLPVKNCTSTMTEIQVLNNTDTVWQKEISNKFKTHFSNRYVTDKKNGVKLGEIRVVLERLPANICPKESSHVTSTNIFPNKKKISQDASLQTSGSKREPQIRKISKILACENGVVVGPVCNNYSLRMNTKENNDEINNTFDNVVDRASQVFDKIESDSAFRHKNCGKASQDKRSKYSVLTFTSSDEDDFVRSIQHPRKRSKVSIDDVLGEPNIAEKDLCERTKLIISDKNKYRCRNSSTAIPSPEKIVQRDIGSIKEKEEHSGVVEIKSLGSTQTAIASLQIHRNEGFVFFSSKDDNDSVADNSDKAKDENSFFDSRKNTSNNSKKRSNGTIMKNEIDRKNNIHVIFFQTKTFDTSSSDSEESNAYTSSTCKALNTTRNRLRYHNCANSKEMLNDSITKRYSKRHSNSLNSSLEKHRTYNDVRTRSKSIDKEARTNKQLVNEEFNDNIKSKTNDIRDTSSSSFINDIRDTSVQEETLSNTLGILEKTNLDSLPGNKEISNKLKNPVVIQQGSVTSTVRKLLTFQTKSYYDSSDSSETW